MSFTVNKNTLYNTIIEAITGPTKSSVEKTKGKEKEISSKNKKNYKKGKLKFPKADPNDLTGDLGDGSGPGKGVYEKENTQSDRSNANEPERQKKWPFEKRTKGKRFGLKEASKDWITAGMSPSELAQYKADATGANQEFHAEDFDHYPEFRMAEDVDVFIAGASKAYEDYMTDFHKEEEKRKVKSADEIRSLSHELFAKHSHFSPTDSKDHDLGYKAGLHLAYDEMKQEADMVSSAENFKGRERATEDNPDIPFVIEFIHDLVSRIHSRYQRGHMEHSRLRQRLSGPRKERKESDIAADEAAIKRLMDEDQALRNMYGQEVIILGDLLFNSRVPESERGDVVTTAIATLTQKAPKLRKILQNGLTRAQKENKDTTRADYLQKVVVSYLNKFHAAEASTSKSSAADRQQSAALYYASQLASFTILNMQYSITNDKDPSDTGSVKATYQNKASFMKHLSEESYAELLSKMTDRMKSELKKGKITVNFGVQYPYRSEASGDDQVVVPKKVILDAITKHLSVFRDMLDDQQQSRDLDLESDDPSQKKKRKGGRTEVEIPDGTWMEYLQKTGRTEKDMLHLSNADETRFIKMVSRELGKGESAIRNELYNHMLAFGMDAEALSDIKQAARVTYATKKIPTVFDPLKLKVQSVTGLAIFDLFRYMFETYLLQGSGRYQKADRKKQIKKGDLITDPNDLEDSESSELINMFLHPKAKNLLRHPPLEAEDIDSREGYSSLGSAEEKSEYLSAAKAGFEMFKDAVNNAGGKNVKKEKAKKLLIAMLKKAKETEGTEVFKKGLVGGLNYAYTVGFFSIIPTTYREIERESAYERSYVVYNYFARGVTELISGILLDKDKQSKMKASDLAKLGLTFEDLENINKFFHDKVLPVPADDLGTSKGRPVTGTDHIDFYLRYAHSTGGVKHLLTVFRAIGTFRAANRGNAETNIQKFSDGMIRLLKTTYKQEAMDILMDAIAGTKRGIKQRRKHGL